MDRVLVIGSGGAGKSSFARRLAGCTGLPLVHLDSLYWRPGWVATPKAEWAGRVDRLLIRDRWVMDGNYAGTLERRLASCDTAVFLDLPRRVCLWRVVKRRIAFHGRARPDMRVGCPERLTGEFLRWIWNYPSQQRPQLLDRLATLGSGCQVFVLRSQAEVEHFFREMGCQPA